MRTSIGLLTILLAMGCKPGTPANAESSECTRSVERARRSGGDSLFADARGLIQRCPDAMGLALAGLWAAPVVTPEQARQLRAVSALVRDERLVAAVEAVVRDPSRPIETRVEGLSTLSYYLQAGRWVEFTFLKDPPDSASLRMFMGMMDKPLGGDGTHAIAPEYAVRFRQMLETLRQSDTSAAMRSAARRFLLFLDYSKQQLEEQRTKKQPPAPPDA